MALDTEGKRILIFYIKVIFVIILLIAGITYIQDKTNNNKSLNLPDINHYHYPITVIDYQETKIAEMRITGYIPTGNKTALMEDVKPGWTAAVSPNCSYMLGSQVYIRGHGVRYVNDLTNSRLDEEFDLCTLDLAVGTVEQAMNIGNNICTVIRLENIQ